MPKPADFPRAKLPPTVWNKIEAAANARAAQGERVYALHVGDTYLPFPKQLTEPLPGEEKDFGSLLNRYSDTYGDRALRELISSKASSRNRLPITGVENVQITGGATGALQAGFSRLLDPGAEVIALAPYWSILRQVADSSGVKLVEVPFFERFGEVDIESYLEGFLTPLTQAIYLNTPSNPTGILLDQAALAAIARFAEANDLWIFADEAYEDYIWDGSPHVSIGALPRMFDRTISVYTFSKCFGASGMRVGYAVGEAAAISKLNRAVVGNYYQPPRPGQLYAWRGMKRFEEALAPFRAAYEPAWRYCLKNLTMATLPSVGGFYFFVRLPSSWENLSPEAKVDRMLDGGVALAPGEYFGEMYRGWARMCFTIIPPDQLADAVERLNRMLG